MPVVSMVRVRSYPRRGRYTRARPKVMPKRKRPFWRITVSYPYGLYTDEEIERLVGKESSGSGVGFGKRDMDWHFRSGPVAERAAKKLARKHRIRVELEKYSDADDLDPIDSYVVK